MGKDNIDTQIRLPTAVRLKVIADAKKKGIPLATMIKIIVCEKYPLQ